MPLFNEWLRLPNHHTVEPSVKMDQGSSAPYVNVLDGSGEQVLRVYGIDPDNAYERAKVAATLLDEYLKRCG